MSDYSGYQRKRAHSLGPFTSVYEATAPNGGPGRFALKIFHPPASSSIRRVYAIEGWLLAAERQQKNAKKDGAVLEVLAFGHCAEGAYCVMPWMERSLEPIAATLAGRGDFLRALAECLLNALEQWGTQTGGSHRKLKAANIFVTRAGPLAGMTVVLSDAWFQLGDKAEKNRMNDLAAVGAILAQIVRRRESWRAKLANCLPPQPAVNVAHRWRRGERENRLARKAPGVDRVEGPQRVATCWRRRRLVVEQTLERFLGARPECCQPSLRRQSHHLAGM